jgi:pSer/pThr/pTyr-binding forkhead associated (FHA) protein
VTLTVEIVEGPGAGRTAALDRPLVLGRDADVDLPLDDTQASRRHARLDPTPQGAVVEDLGSTNGTFVNANAVHGRAAINAGDELTVGVTVLRLRSAGEVERQPSAVRAIPPGLAAAPRRPTYTDPSTGPAGLDGREDSGVPELERLRDRRTRTKASLAPLAILVLAALAVIVYLGVT